MRTFKSFTALLLLIVLGMMYSNCYAYNNPPVKTVMHFHNAEVSIKGSSLNVFKNNVSGTGVLNMMDSTVKANNVSCGITVNEDAFSVLDFMQNCEDGDIASSDYYQVFAMNGEYLYRFESYEDIFTGFISKRGHLVLIVYKNGVYFNKIKVNN